MWRGARRTSAVPRMRQAVLSQQEGRKCRVHKAHADMLRRRRCLAASEGKTCLLVRIGTLFLGYPRALFLLFGGHASSPHTATVNGRRCALSVVCSVVGNVMTSLPAQLELYSPCVPQEKVATSANVRRLPVSCGHKLSHRPAGVCDSCTAGLQAVHVGLALPRCTWRERRVSHSLAPVASSPRHPTAWRSKVCTAHPARAGIYNEAKRFTYNLVSTSC